MLEVVAEQQKILRYWTKYAFFYGRPME